MQYARQYQGPDLSGGARSGGRLFTVLSTLLRRGETAPWPALDGFCNGRELSLPAGEVFAQEGVELLSGASAGARATPSCEEAWIAGRDGQDCWYALWCPYAERWEILRCELGPPGSPRHPGAGTAIAQ